MTPPTLIALCVFLLLGGATAFADGVYADSLDFTLDTTGGASGLYADSADFTLDTTVGASGLYADSTDFTLDTTGGSSGLYADSGDFTLNSTGQPGGSRGVAFADSGDFELNTTGVSSGVSGTASADSADFTLDTISTVPLPSGVVAWWQAENNALDTFGSHPGTLLGGAGFAPGLVGQAFSFDGVNQSVEVTSSPGVSFGGTSSITVELWAYRTGSSAVMHLVGKRSSCVGGGGTINFQLALNTVTGEGLNFGAGLGNEAASGLDLPLNTWTHLAGTFDGTSFRIYVNGDLKATQTGALGPVNASPLEIGGSGGCAKFAGFLDEVTLYDRALSGPEVQAIYNAGAGGKGADTPIITTLATLADGQLNAAYAQALAAALGTPPYTFAPVGPMPPGLTLSSAGAIGGAPSAFGNLSFTAQVTDALGKSSTKLFSLYVQPYSGNVYVWNNSGGDWSDATRWIPNGVPGPNDFAAINNGTVVVSTDQAVGQLNFTGGQIMGAATLTVNGLLNWTGGSMGYNVENPGSLSGTTLIAAGAECRVGSAGGVILTARTLENAGRLIWTGTGGIALRYGAVIINRPQALFEVQNDTYLQWGTGAAARFDNAGIFRKRNSPGTTLLDVDFNNTGTVDVQTGRLECPKPETITTSGIMTVAAGAIINTTGFHYLTDGAQLLGEGLYRVSANLISVTGAAVVENLDLLGTLTGTGTLLVKSNMTWPSGRMAGGGRTVIASGATLSLNGTAGVQLDGRTLENAGTVKQVDNGTLALLYGAVFTNRPGGVIDLQTNAVIGLGGTDLSPRIDNAGFFRKTAGAGITSVSYLAFNNYGTNEVLLGTLQFDHSPYIQYAGLTSVCGGNIANGPPLQIRAGELRGRGYISGDVNHSGGTVLPGCSPGQLTIGGNYIQGANGTLEIEVAGTAPGITYDRLVVGGSATLGGTLRTTLANGFYPPANASFTFLTAASSSGSFAAIYYPSNDLGEQVVYTANSASVKIVNVRPNLPAIPPQTIDEMVLFTLPVGATDDDTPAQTLSYTLLNAPPGATINGSGTINWIPTEEQGPMTTNLTVRVTDNGTPNLSATNTFTVVVNEVNVAPTLGALSDQTVNPGQTVSFTATATDSDLPANALAFSLLSPPPGATITSDGLFNWRPSVALRNTTNTIQVRVQDNGAPVLNDTRSFKVIVNPLAAPVVLTPLGHAPGQFTLGVTGPLGPDYVIMGSTNLRQWSDLTTNLSPALPFQHTDPQAGSFSNRAYRVRLQP